MGVPLFSIALRSDHGILAAGGQKALHLFNVRIKQRLLELSEHGWAVMTRLKSFYRCWWITFMD